MTAALVAAFAAATCIAADSRAFTVGVLRRDGVVIPFAGFDGKRWTPVWPDPAKDVEVPIDLRNVPRKWWGPAGPVDTWQATIGAAAPVTLHVRQPDLIPAQCLRQIGLRTDYHSAEPPPPFDQRPYPKDGFVVAPPQPIDRIQVLGATSAEWKEFGPLVAGAFNKAEADIASNEGSETTIKKDVREATAPTIEAIYAYGTDPRIYRVEAAREYWSEPKTNACLGMAFGHVWLIRDGAVAKPVRTVVTAQSCDRSDAVYQLPLGVIAAGGRLFWIAQMAGWDIEYFEIVEINRAKIVTVLARPGGIC